MRPSAGFLLRFFALAGVLFALWSFAGLGDAWGRLTIALASPLVRVTSGFGIDRVEETPKGLNVFIRRDQLVELMPLQPREVFSGLIPFLALVGATTAVPWRRRLQAAAIGVAALLVFHLGLVLLGPYMTGHPQAQLGQAWMRRINSGINVFYGFYGLVGYAALPFILWWVLLQRHVLTPAAEDRPRRGGRDSVAPR